LDARLFELQSGIVKESMAREEADQRLVERAQGASAEAAAAAVKRAVEHADMRFAEAAEAAASLEARLLQCLAEESARCLNEAACGTEETAGHLREEMGQAAQRARQQALDSRDHADSAVKATADALRGEQAEAAERLMAAAEQAVKEKADVMSTHLHHKLEQSGLEASRASTDAIAPL